MKVCRFPWKSTEQSWGLELDEGSLRIRGYTAGSVAAECNSLQTYIGWELASIDGRPMRSLAEVQRKLEQCDRSPGREDLGSARFCFRESLPSEQPMQSEEGQYLHELTQPYQEQMLVRECPRKWI